MKRRHHQRPQGKLARGFSLLEMLVAIVVFSIGLIGVAIMQLKGMSYTKDAGARSQATILARGMADRMRTTMQEAFRGPVIGNVDWMEQVDYRIPTGIAASTQCLTACTLQQSANNDVFWLTTQVTAKLPPSPTAKKFEITRAVAPSQVHTLTVFWGESGAEQKIAFDVFPM